MVLVKGRSDFGTNGPPGLPNIANLTQLGLCVDDIRVTPTFKHKGMTVDAWGEVDVDVQWMMAEVAITMNLIHFDQLVLDACVAESMGGAPDVGAAGRAGTRLGGGLARFAAGNHLIGLNIEAPVSGRPWRFYYAYLAQSPTTYPLGVEKSIVAVHWRAIPYTNDPWGGGSAQPATVAGTGSEGAYIWDRQLDV